MRKPKGNLKGGIVRKTENRLITIPRLIILALLLLVMTMGLWIFLRGALVKSLIGGIANLETQGYEVTHGGLTIEGFPFSISAVSQDISVRAPRSSTPSPVQNWSIKTGNLQMRSATLTPLSWDIRHTGQMRIDMHGRAGERYWFEIAPTNIEARAVASLRGTLKSARFDMGRAQLNSLVGTPPIISKIEHLDGNIKVTDAVANIALRAKDLRLSPKIPAIIDNILGRKLSLIELNANIDNWPLLEASGAQAWQTAAGRIKAEHWAVLWGNADMVGNFDLTFKNGKPEGTIQIRIKNAKSLIDNITAAGLIPAQYTGTINSLITMRETDEEGRKTIDLTIKNGTVKMGFIPIFEF